MTYASDLKLRQQLRELTARSEDLLPALESHFMDNWNEYEFQVDDEELNVPRIEATLLALGFRVDERYETEYKGEPYERELHFLLIGLPY